MLAARQVLRRCSAPKRPLAASGTAARTAVEVASGVAQLPSASAAAGGLSWAPGSGASWAPGSGGSSSSSSGGREGGGGGGAVGPRRVRVAPEEISYSVVIESCSRRGDARGAAGWLQEMASSPFGPNVFAFNAVIAVFARLGESREAASWLDSMIAEGLRPNVVSYTAVIDGCAKAGDAKGAVRWFETMLDNGIKPNALSYNAVINSFARQGDAEGAVKWLNRMRKEMLPDEISYNSAIHACATADPARADEAERLFREMVTTGLQPTASTLTALERAVGARRRDSLSMALGVDMGRAMRNRPPPANRKAASLGPSRLSGGRGA